MENNYKHLSNIFIDDDRLPCKTKNRYDMTFFDVPYDKQKEERILEYIRRCKEKGLTKKEIIILGKYIFNT